MSKIDGDIRDWHFAAVIAFGMLARLLWSFFVPIEPVSDSFAYDAHARTLAEHGVYGWTPSKPTAFWAVGTSAIVAANYALGLGYAGVVALNLSAALVSMVLVWRLGEIWFDRLTALIATAVYAVWPNLIFFTTIISSELFFIALTLLGLWLWERREGSAALNLALCGLAWGLACYVRPVVLLLPFALILSSLTHGVFAIRRTALKAAAATVLIVAVVSPWTYRNMQVLGEPVLVSSNLGVNLWMGNNPDSDGKYMFPPKWSESLSETERNDALGQIARDYILADIPGFIVRTLRKAFIVHSGETIGVGWNKAAIERGIGETGVTILKIIASGYWFAVLAAALGGIILLARQNIGAAFCHPAVVSWAYFVAIPAVIAADHRYHMPATPFITILGATLFAALVRRVLAANKAPVFSHRPDRFSQT